VVPCWSSGPFHLAAVYMRCLASAGGFAAWCGRMRGRIGKIERIGPTPAGFPAGLPTGWKRGIGALLTLMALHFAGPIAAAHADEPPPLHYAPSSADPEIAPHSEPHIEVDEPGRGAPFERAGLMLRCQAGAGAGWLEMIEPEGRDSVRVRDAGVSLPGVLSAGGSLGSRWALHGDLAWMALLPVGGRQGPGASADRIRDLALSLGVGATYFFPRDIFASLSLGLGLFVEDRDGGRPVQTNPGPMLSLSVGRTYWYAPDLSLGFSVLAQYADAQTRFRFNPGRARLATAAIAAVVAFH